MGSRLGHLLSFAPLFPRLIAFLELLKSKLCKTANHYPNQSGYILAPASTEALTVVMAPANRKNDLGLPQFSDHGTKRNVVLEKGMRIQKSREVNRLI